MTGWPPWRRAEPAQLARYVHTGVLAKVLRPELGLPGRSGAPPQVRVRQLFEAFAGAGMRYADEQPAAAGEQDIRTPDQVFVRPGLGNCLDLAVSFAGGCLDAGLHPMIVTLSPVGPGGAAHAIVIVWLRGDLHGAVAYPLAEVVHEAPPQWPGMGLRTSWDASGEFVAIDIARAAHGWPPGSGQVEFDEAVTAAAEMLTSRTWAWEHGVDIGLAHDPTVVHPLPGWPDRDPLEAPYHPPAPDSADLGPLESVRARNRIVPFEPRQILDDLYDWCLTPDSVPGESRLRLAVVHGVGGSGKTRLAAELAARLVETDRWYAGFLRRDLTRSGAPTDELIWLGGVVGPVLVVVDYVEAADRTTLAEALAVLARRHSSTIVLLTARYPGDWRTTLDNELGSRGVHPKTRPDTRLNTRHPRVEVVYRRAYRRFSPTSGAPDLPPELPATSTRWTTLDVVMLAWLAARHPSAQLPADRATLYEQILGREFDNWNAALRSRFGREADPAALRRAATMVSLLSPTPQMVPAALEAVRIGELTSLAIGEITGILARFLTDPTGQVFELRPDPLADHLIVTDLHPGEDFDRCLELVAKDVDLLAKDPGPNEQAVFRLVENVTRAADQNPTTAAALATATLRRHPTAWPAALGTVWTRGGPFVGPLEELARHDDTPLPLHVLARDIPLGHGALRTLALIAAQRSQPPLDPDEHNSHTLNQTAIARHTLSIRQSDTGDRTGALTSITEAVQIRRKLAKHNPATFLPDLAMSLNDLAVMQSGTGDRAGGLASITDAVRIRRDLVEQNPAAFLPTLAGSLNTLSIRQSKAGDRAGALASITEAVSTYRELVEQNPPAFWPDLAASLNTLSLRQSETGDPAGALTSITEAVQIGRELVEHNPAAFLPGLATSLNNLSLLLSEAGDRAGALAPITEAVSTYRGLVEQNPAAFFPALAMSLNTLSNRQSEAGDRAGALASITEAVSTHRGLVEQNPAAFLPELAGSLGTLSIRQFETGDLTGAVTSITEATQIRRELVEQNPAAFLPDLATSLNTLSNLQSETGDLTGALTSITEAVQIHRKLVEHNPAAFLPDLAGSLHSLANQQSETGDPAGALTSITEAVQIHRELAKQNPAAFLPDLAKSLSTLSLVQSEAGDWAGALASITETVQIRRELAEHNPAAFLPELARSLNTASVQQSEAGDWVGALDSITEAVQIRRRLVERNSATGLPELAMSLNNLSLLQSEAGDRARALTSIIEAVSTYRSLVEQNPAEFLPELAGSLNTLSQMQSEIGDPARALTSITEAVSTYRSLVEQNPAEFLPNLATSLNNLSVWQSETGDAAGALASITEAVRIRRKLVEHNPAAFLPDLAGSLNNLSLRQSETGDAAGALASITEAIRIRRKLVEHNPAAFLPDLAGSLNNLSKLQSETGETAAALTSITEAVSTYRGLVQQRPAAFLPKLAMALKNMSNLLVTLDGDSVQAAMAWADSGAQLPAASKAELLCHRSEWHRNRSNTTAALTDLNTAAALIDLVGRPDDPSALANARQHIRALLVNYEPSDLSRTPFPSWLTTPIPEAVINLANRWIAADWSQRKQILTAPDTPTDRDLLRALFAVYCDHPELQYWVDIVDDINARGQDVVFAEMDAGQETVSLVQDWINTPSWNASQAFLGRHPALRGTNTVAVLEKWSDDQEVRQHLAILRLTEHVPAGDVYDAILDPGDARQLLLHIARTGSAELIAEVWYATPHLAADPFIGALAAALVQALGDVTEYPDEIDQALRAAAAAASTSERRDTLILLRALATTRDDRVEPLRRIATAIAPTSEHSD